MLKDLTTLAAIAWRARRRVHTGGGLTADHIYVAITAAAYMWLPVATALGLPARVAWCAALPAPIAIWRIAQIADHRDPAHHERLALFAVALLVATSVAELVGFLLDSL